jgi:hypothetical protein
MQRLRRIIVSVKNMIDMLSLGVTPPSVYGSCPGGFGERETDRAKVGLYAGRLFVQWSHTIGAYAFDQNHTSTYCQLHHRLCRQLWHHL